MAPTSKYVPTTNGPGMTMTKATAWVLIIASIGTVLTSTINIWRTEQVHEVVNSAKAAVDRQVELLQSESAAKSLIILQQDNDREALAREAAEKLKGKKP